MQNTIDVEPTTHVSETTKAPSAKWQTFAVVALLFVISALVFLPGTRGEFIYDDHVDVFNVDNVFTPGAWPKLFTTASAQLYRPLKYLSYYVDNAVFGRNPTGWHWQSLLWHAANSVLVLLLVRRFAQSLMAVAIAGLWFAVHPIHAEAVVWISSRASLQATFGVLLVLLCYMRWRDEERAVDLAGVVIGGAIGFFSKEDALMVLPILAAYEWFVRGDKPIGLLKQSSFLVPIGALCALAATYLVLRQSILVGLKQGAWEAGASGWIATLPVILATYVRQLIWPDPMCIDQPVNYSAGFGLHFWATAILLTGALLWLITRRGEARNWKFALAFFLIALIPVSGVIPINQPRADRFLYLPSVAGALCVAWFWNFAFERDRWRIIAVTLVSASVGWFTWRSWDYSKTFLNDTVLWEEAVRINPRSYRGFANLGALENNAGKPEIALRFIDQALTIKPDHLETLVMKAYSLMLLGRLGEAEAIYRDVLTAVPDEPRWMYLRAYVLEQQKRQEDAEKVYDRIAEVRPGYIEARLAAGLLAAQMNKPDKARAHWRAVLEYDPANAKAKRNLEVLERSAKD